MTIAIVNSIVLEIHDLSRQRLSVWENESRMCGNVMAACLAAAVVVIACGMAGVL